MTAEELLCKIVQEFYELDQQNGCGVSLHTVLDDGNLRSGDIKWCERWAEDYGDRADVFLARILQSVPFEMLEDLSEKYWHMHD